ncbi:hypothetical protein H4Q26_008235 [Puccinia striiformis f. sp. tritici PST-130]|nr:hypothetical protein H4Q26_008235 [Puccinia striiformis f. sp. tritici PST-130]
MRFQPSRRLSITGSRSRSKPSLKWMPLVTGALLTVLYFDTKHTRVSYLANQQAGETFESSAPSDFKDSLERITNPYRVPGHPSPSGGLLKRTPQSPYTREPVTITEREDATVVNVTLRDNPIVINVEDEEDSTTHVITIIGFDENSQPIANTISGSQSSIGVNSTTVVTATTTINTNPTLRIDNTAAVNQDKGMRDLTSAANFKYGFTQKVNARFNAGQSGGALRRLSVSRKPAPKPDTAP